MVSDTNCCKKIFVFVAVVTKTVIKALEAIIFLSKFHFNVIIGCQTEQNTYHGVFELFFLGV